MQKIEIKIPGEKRTRENNNTNTENKNDYSNVHGKNHTINYHNIWLMQKSEENKIGNFIRRS